MLWNSWEGLVDEMKKQNQPVVIARVDCMSASALCSRFGVTKFPSFVGFIQGEKVSEYEGTDFSPKALLEATNTVTIYSN